MPYFAQNVQKNEILNKETALLHQKNPINLAYIY